MPSEESFLEKAEGYKTSGNEAFSKENWTEAIHAYSLGLAQIDRMVECPSTVVTLKTSLLSNRAAASLKVNQLKECQDDCTTALNLISTSSSSSTSNGSNTVASLHAKLLFRRAKATFLLANAPHQTNAISNELLQEAAKDLLTLLSEDPKNQDATKLLQSIRGQHSLQTQATNTPIAKTLDKVLQLSKEGNVTGSDDALHQVKVLLGLITNDLVSGSMELGRRGGVKLLLELAATKAVASSSSKSQRQSPFKLQALALSCLASAGSHPPFCRSYCQDIQPNIVSLLKDYCKQEEETGDASDVIISALALYLRLLLHLDRDDPKSDEIKADSKMDTNLMNQACLATLAVSDVRVIRATLDLLLTWTAGQDRDATIRASLAEHGADGDLPTPKTPAEIRSLAPRELSDYRKREYQIKQRDQDWAQQRAFVFCKAGGIDALLKCSLESCNQQNTGLRRELNVVLGRLLAAIDDEKGIQSLVQPFLGTPAPEKETDEQGLTIEEVYDEDEETKGQAKGEDVEEVVPLSTLQQRAELTSALLLAKSEVGAWAMGTGWDTVRQDLRTMIASKDRSSMFLASEVISAAASVEKTRPTVAAMLRNGTLETLLGCDYREVRSGVASAIAKLDLSEKKTDEGEIMGLLQVAVDLLYESETNGDTTSKETSSSASRFSQSFGATSSMDRGIEMLNYLVSQTSIKEELAHGFRCHHRGETSNTALERLVELATRPGAGESVSAYAIATIFMHIAVSSLTLRKEAFEGKDISMEDYDQMQQLGKSQEEKDAAKEEPDDTQNAVDERIRLMARANVPRALVQLMEGASDTAVEQVLTAMNRMAVETSSRGIMIQQGVLSACIKVERGENPSAIGKKILRSARHCISKLLASSNPSLLTASQRIGSVKPLIQLIRDSEASDLQIFEALLAITNVAAAGDDAKERIIAEKGISSLSFAMFSGHEMVRRAATEAMCNLVPHPAMMTHLADPEHAGLWLAFAADHEQNYECARAAAGCLAMASQDPDIAKTIVHLTRFNENTKCVLESGRLELMHRVLVLIYNLTQQDDECREAVVSNGLSTFCKLYADSYHDGSKAAELDDITAAERDIIPVTIELAQEIVKATE